MPMPATPKIYHIVHIDRLSSIIADGYLWCDAEIVWRGVIGTTIGMNSIKERRLAKTLASHPTLHVGDCVPFYFCPRSVMLFMIYMGNHPELSYRGGQSSIIHLEADLRQAVAWADAQGRRWAFTRSNAGAYYFEDYSDLTQLDEVDWDAVQARDWRRCKERKQAEFLVEYSFPWKLVSRIGILSRTYEQVQAALQASGHRPPVQIKLDWYY